MLDVARQRARKEVHDLWAIARRNPLTVAGICIGLVIPVFVLHGVEGRIGNVERTSRIDHQTVVRVSACAARPHSRLCLLGITRALRTCLADRSCGDLIRNPPVAAPPQPPPSPKPQGMGAAPPVSAPEPKHGAAPHPPHHPSAPEPPEEAPGNPEPPAEVPAGDEAPEQAPPTSPPEAPPPPAVEPPELCVTANPLVNICLTG